MKNPLKLFNKNRVTTIVFDEIDSMCDRFGLGNVDLIYKEFCADPRIQVHRKNYLNFTFYAKKKFF